MIGGTNDWHPMNSNQPYDDRRIATEIRVLFGVMAKTMRMDQEARLQAANIEMSHLQIIMMRILNHEGGRTISELSKMIMCDPSTLVPSSEGLVRKGYVHRIRDPQDRRRVLLYVTPEGLRVMETLDAMPEDDILLTCVRQMGIESSQQLLAHMRQMVTLLPGGATMYEQIQARILAQLHATSQSDAETPAHTTEQSNIRE
jgi:DNA-binding MarR family transcriptional regulator